jgi:hypothetical protein
MILKEKYVCGDSPAEHTNSFPSPLGNLCGVAADEVFCA